MQAPSSVIEIFLQPGELYFGDENTRIRTVLGSCVSMVFWHPHHRVGGMCHYMLPAAGNGWNVGRERPLDGRYADEAIDLLLEEMRNAGTSSADYHVKVFGGGDMFSGTPKSGVANVGQRNVEAARHLVQRHGFTCVAEHLGGTGHRNVIFDVWSGHVWVKHQPQGGSAQSHAHAGASSLYGVLSGARRVFGAEPPALAVSCEG